MQHSGTITLETPRLILRRFIEEDAHDVFANWMGQPEAARYTGWTALESEFETECLVCAWCAAYQDSRVYKWAIVCKADGHVIGSISAGNFSERHERCELDYVLGKTYHNAGYMTEALRAVIGDLFGRVGCHKICGSCVSENPASARVMEKCGMRREGLLRGQHKNREGAFADVLVYGILREDAHDEA